LISDSETGEDVGFGVLLTGDVRNREVEGPDQLATGPVQGVQTGTAALVFTGHLLDHDLGVRENVKPACFEGEGELQGFEEGDIFGHIIVLTPDPLGDPDGNGSGTLDNDSNTGRAGVT
jgi:hypothetical protein